jgi:hypothetical protein
MFERMPIDQLLSLQPIVVTEAVSPNHLTLLINVGTLLIFPISWETVR